MATRTISVVGGNWSATTAWVEAAVPTAADDVVATNLSGNLTIDGTSGSPSLCRSANFTNYVGTLTWAAAKQLNVGDGSGGSLIFVAGMTASPSSTSVLKMISTTTGNSLTFAGKVLGVVEFNGAGGGWTLTDDPNTTRDYTFTAGTVTFGSTFHGHVITGNGGTINATGGTTTLTSTSSIAGATFNGAGQSMVCTTFTVSSGSYTIGTHTGSGSFTNSGGTVAFGAGGVSCTSMTNSAGTTTSSGTVVSTTGSVGITVTGSLDATGQAVNPTTSLSLSSSGTFKAATVTAGTTITQSNGTWQTTGNIQCTTFTCSGSTARSLSLGSGTVTLTGTGTVWSFGSAPTNLTFTPGTSLIKSTDTSATTKSCTLGGQTFNNFQVSGAASCGTFTFNTVGGTFNTLTLDPDSNIRFFSTATFTATTLSASGTSGHAITMNASVAASAAVLAIAAANITMDYVNMQDLSIGPNAAYAGANSNDNTGNTGWIFGGKPTSGQPNARCA